jgi:hypothetical protein
MNPPRVAFVIGAAFAALAAVVSARTLRAGAAQATRLRESTADGRSREPALAYD